MPLPTPRVYATPADYTQYVGAGGVIPARLDYQLRLASQVIDLAMTGAEYDTDTSGMPTDTDVAATMCQATCQQAEAQAEIDDPTGAKERFDAVSISGVSVHRVAGSAGGALPSLCQQAALTLFNAGAIPGIARQGRY